MTSGIFANNKKTEKKEIQTSYQCCTATLTYNGEPVDSETVCGMITQGDNCTVAKNKLLDRNPEAKKALSESLEP